MTTAEIITIGTEILLGEITDTNSREIARRLRESGYDLFRVTSIGDNPERIASAIREALERADIVITTGGLGPTVDDPTREAAALAFGVSTEFRPDLWEQVVERFASFGRYPSENNRKQAAVPRGAIPIVNPVGTAPGFMIETPAGALIALPGVPREMEYLLETFVLPHLTGRYPPDGVLRVRVLHTAGVGESQVDEKILDFETLANPTVGLAAHAGQVDVRITAKAQTEAEAFALIEEIEVELRQRLGSWVYGSDSETLADLAMRKLVEKEWSLALLESGIGGILVSQFPAGQPGLQRASLFPLPPEDPRDLLPLCAGLRQDAQADVCLGIGLYSHPEKPFIALVLLSPGGEKTRQVPYGGPPGLASTRAVNFGLDWLRKLE